MLLRECIKVRGHMLSLLGHCTCLVNLDRELDQKVHLHPNGSASWMDYIKGPSTSLEPS